MTYMLCRNRVADFEKWKSIFDTHAEAHRKAGLKLVHLWRSLEEPNNVFFVFELETLEKAKAFISNPEADQAGEASGVVDGEYHFVEDAGM